MDMMRLPKGWLSASSTFDRGTERGNSSVHLTAQENEHRGNRHRYQSTGYGVFHNGQAVFII
jgi:hypothetical protein